MLIRLLASLIALTLIAGVPAIASTAAASADCVALTSASSDDGCCGGADMARCALACAVASSTAAVGNTAEAVPVMLSAAPLACIIASPDSPARPPDTAPPKPLSV
ncbi:MAG TPA: hypothetical protein VHG33_11055 [Woeseiaceae bacterium]|nr:hypothetical protein [Woeseiaceae bacterium]